VIIITIIYKVGILTGILITLLYCLRFWRVRSHYFFWKLFDVPLCIRHVKCKYYIHIIIFREIRNALTKEKRKTGASGPKSLHVLLLLYIINYNIRALKTFGFYETTSYGCREEKKGNFRPDIGVTRCARKKNIRRSLRGRRLHPHVCDHMFILDITAGRPCATRMNLVLADIYILLFILCTYLYINIISIQTGVCVALKDIGRPRHPLASLVNSSKRREYTQIVCSSPSLTHSLSLTISHFISLTISVSVSVSLNWCVRPRP